MVFRVDVDHATNIFHNFAEYLYGNNMVEQQNWEPGRWYLTSLNFGGLEDASSFQVNLFWITRSHIFIFYHGETAPKNGSQC